jgi:hypothetical protein
VSLIPYENIYIMSEAEGNTGAEDNQDAENRAWRMSLHEIILAAK